MPDRSYMEKSTIIGIIVFLILCAVVIYAVEQPRDIENDDLVHVYFMNTVEADSILIKEKDYVVMIDTGEEKERSLVLNRLQELGVQKIDLLILTHPDKDHIGNAKAVLEKYPVSKVYLSSYIKESTLEKQLKEYIQKKKIDSTIIQDEKELTYGSMHFTIYPPLFLYDDSNNDSLITVMQVGKNRFFFGADIKKKRVKEVLEQDFPPVDVIKVPYHGRYHEELVPLLEKLQPTVAIITGAPSQLEEYLKEKDILTYYTEKQEIHLVSDGETIRIK